MTIVWADSVMGSDTSKFCSGYCVEFGAALQELVDEAKRIIEENPGEWSEL